MKRNILTLLLTILFALSPIYTVYGDTAPEVAGHTSVTVSLEDDGLVTYHTTTAATVAEFLESQGIQIMPYDVVSPELYVQVTQEMRISICRSFEIIFAVYDAASVNYATAQALPAWSIRDAAAYYGNEYNAGYSFDMQYADSPVAPGMIINIYAESVMNHVTNEAVPFGIEYIYTDRLPQGYEMPVYAGEHGTVFITEEIVYHGTQEISRRKISEELTLAPKHAIIAFGIGSADTPIPETLFTGDESLDAVLLMAVQTNDDIDYANLYNDLYNSSNSALVVLDGQGGGKVISTQPPVNNQPQPIIDGIYFEYSKELAMSATAYTNDYASTGKRPGDKWFGITASGMKSQVGVVAVDPKVIPLFTKLYIEGYGFAIAGDTGKSVKGNIIDLFFDTPGEVKQFGRQNRKVYILTDQEYEIALKH